VLTIPARESKPRFGVLSALGGALLLALLVLLLLLLLRTGASKPSAPLSGENVAADGRTPSPTAPRAQAARGVRSQAPRPAAPALDEEDARVEEPSAPPTQVDPDDPAVVAVRAAALDRSTAGTKQLIASLQSSDEVIVAEAANALVQRRATQAIAELAAIGLDAAAGSGLSIIDALGRLGALAGADDKSVAVDRLLAMLAEEKQRGARESAANLIQIYEALGQTRDPSAAVPLEAELLDGAVPRAPKVVIVNALVAIGQTESRTALSTALAEQTSTVAADSFEEEIRQELVGVIEKALQTL